MLHQKAPKANSIEDTKICQKENGRDVIITSAYNRNNTLKNNYLTRTRSIASLPCKIVFGRLNGKTPIISPKVIIGVKRIKY